jgi:MFS family permease
MQITRPASSQSQRLVVILASTYLILAANGGLFLLVVALKQIAQDFDWPRTVPSLAYSFQFLGSGLGGIVMGYWFDRSGVGPVTLLGTIMIGSGAILGGMITAQWQLYVIYGVMMGFLGQATMFGPLMVNVMRWFAHRRGFAVGVVAAGQSVAGALWPPIFRYFNESVGWRETFFWFGVFALVTAVPLSLLLWRRAPGGPPASARETTPAAAPAAAPPAVLSSGLTELGLPTWMLQTTLCLAIVGCCVAMSMPLAHLVAHASDLGHPTARAAEMLAVALATTLVVRLLAGTLIVDRFGGLTALLVFSATQAAALALYAVVDGLWALYLVSMLFGMGYGGINLCYPVIVHQYLPPAEAGRRLGVVILFGASGMALGGWLAGYVFDLTGVYAPAFLIGAAFNVANLVIVLALLNRQRTLRLQAAMA